MRCIHGSWLPEECRKCQRNQETVVPPVSEWFNKYKKMGEEVSDA